MLDKTFNTLTKCTKYLFCLITFLENCFFVEIFFIDNTNILASQR